MSIKMRGSMAVIQSLLAEHVDTIFGYPGGAIMPIYDDLLQFEDKIHHILVRHEQGAAHATQAYSQVSGKVGVCFGTSGPGATNLITGIANAQIDSVPMVVITAQVPSPLIGTDAFQETDVVGLTMPITKWNVQVTDAEDIPEAIAKAFYIAVSGRPGVVVVDITKDALLNQLEFEYEKAPKIRSYFPYPAINMQSIDAAAELINKSKKPLVLLGHGVLIGKAESLFCELVEKAELPVASTLLGLSAFPSSHKLFVGMLGMHGNYAPNIKTNEADVIIAIGMRFDDRVTGRIADYAKQAKIIHIEIDKSEINKNIEVDVAVHADVKTALTALLPKIQANAHSDWLNEFKELEKIEIEKVITKECKPESGKIRQGEVVHLLSEKTKGHAILVTDVGQNQMMGARYFKFENPNSLITSGGLGTMGFGLPAAMGVAAVVKDRPVIAFLGDGGIQMTIQELGTIMQENLSVKIVVVNNNFLGMVRQWQDMFMSKRYAATHMVTPDFIKIAEGYNIKGRKVEKREELSAAIDEMFATDGSFLLEVMVEKEGNVFPMITPGASVSEIVLE
jgi:acetolactate synthase-1/2/3 large subunit